MHPESSQVIADVIGDSFSEAQSVLIDLFRCELGQHAAQVALQVFFGHLHDLLRITAEKALDGVVPHLGIAAHLHIGDRLDVQRCAPLGVGVLHLHQHRQQRDIHAAGGFQDRLDESPAAVGYHPIALHSLLTLVAAASCDHKHLVGPADPDHPATDQVQGYQKDEQSGNTADHRIALVAVGGKECRCCGLGLKTWWIRHGSGRVDPWIAPIG